MGFKIKVEPKARLCCVLNAEIECIFCGEVMCYGCGHAWSPFRHYVLDMCRGRFTSKELEAAAKCYKDRIKQGNGALKKPGKCKICKARPAIGNDRHWTKYDDGFDF